MIRFLEGKITDRDGKSLILQVGGIGYEVWVTPDVMEKSILGQEIKLWTSHIVREDTEDLYGFIEKTDLVFFEMLLTVSGIGPKSALGIISLAPTQTLVQAIRSGQSSYLTSVSGIGKKTAEKILLELGDKVGALEKSDTEHFTGNDLLEALESLGYRNQDIRSVLGSINTNDGQGTEIHLKEALKLLSKKR
ncbi:MAG: Holliday junction branch migration protein RuvA [Candidatus Pacebacteria bacterium]|nr:Holliday junction branch migration protein RuvA [Candidatus Paceibacterota bacterium]